MQFVAGRRDEALGWPTPLEPGAGIPNGGFEDGVILTDFGRHAVARERDLRVIELATDLSHTA